MWAAPAGLQRLGIGSTRPAASQSCPWVDAVSVMPIPAWLIAPVFSCLRSWMAPRLNRTNRLKPCSASGGAVHPPWWHSPPIKGWGMASYSASLLIWVTEKIHYFLKEIWIGGGSAHTSPKVTSAFQRLRRFRQADMILHKQQESG